MTVADEIAGALAVVCAVRIASGHSELKVAVCRKFGFLQRLAIRMGQGTVLPAFQELAAVSER